MLAGLLVMTFFGFGDPSPWLTDWLCIGPTQRVLFVYLVVWHGASCAGCSMLCADPSVVASHLMLFVP